MYSNFLIVEGYIMNIFLKDTRSTKRKYKILSIIIALAVSFSIFSCMSAISSCAYDFTPDNINIKSEAVYMENLDTENTIIDINSETQYYPASLTKIMTCVLVLDAFKDNVDGLKKEKISAGSEAFKELENTFASTAGIQKNEKLSYYDLLCALMIPSAVRQLISLQ